MEIERNNLTSIEVPKVVQDWLKENEFGFYDQVEKLYNSFFTISNNKPNLLVIDEYAYEFLMKDRKKIKEKHPDKDLFPMPKVFITERCGRTSVDFFYVLNK